MKKIFGFLLLGVMLLGFSAAGLVVGNPDNECQVNGFDYGIAKYACGYDVPDDVGSASDDYELGVEWTFDEEEEDECSLVDWTANPEVAGVLSKEAAETFVYSGGLSGTVEQGDHSISHVTFCGNYPPVVPEFGGFVAGLTILGALGAFFLVRRK